MAALDENFGTLKGACEKDSTGFAWQLLAGVYLSHGLVKEVEKSYHQWLKNTG